MRWRDFLIAASTAASIIAAWLVIAAYAKLTAPWAWLSGVVVGNLSTLLVIRWYLSRRRRKPTAAPELARQNPMQSVRCACCKETRCRNGGQFICGCGWSAVDLLNNRCDDYTCSKHKRSDADPNPNAVRNPADKA